MAQSVFFYLVVGWAVYLYYRVIKKKYKLLHLTTHLLATGIYLSYTAIIGSYYEYFYVIDPDFHDLGVVILAWIVFPSQMLMFLRHLPQNRYFEYILYIPFVILLFIIQDYMLASVGVMVRDGRSFLFGTVKYIILLYSMVFLHQAIGMWIRYAFERESLE